MVAAERTGAAMISVRHKRRGQQGTHIVAVQAVSESGLVVDDPFGTMRPDYNAGARGDGRARDRKNVVDTGSTSDWQMSAPIADNEVKGESSGWSDTTVSSAWQYLMLFHRGGAARAATGTP